MLKLIILIIVVCSSNLHTQVNAFNSAGKRQGYWIEYIDENMQLIDSSANAFKRLQFYQNGKPLYPYKVYPRRLKYSFIKSKSYNDSTKYLEGMVISDFNGTTELIDIYKNGYPVNFFFCAYLTNFQKDTGYVEKMFFYKISDTTTVALNYQYWSNGRNNNLELKKRKAYIKNKKGTWNYVKLR